MKDQEKPSQQLRKDSYDGQNITDSSGRTITLRKPSILDQYYLKKALGEDATQESCLQMMWPILYVAKIDNSVFQTPKIYSDCLANLSRLGEEGLVAVGNHLAETLILSEKEQTDSVKK